MQSRLASLAGIVALLLLATTPARAQEAEASTPDGKGFGLKAGVGGDPTQIVLGAQWGIHFRRLRVFRLVPNIHFGFGDQTTTDFNADLLIRLPTGKGFAIYGGGTPTVTTTSGGESDVGGTWVFGAQIPVIKNRATNLEARFGAGGAPKFRLLGVIVF